MDMNRITTGTMAKIVNGVQNKALKGLGKAGVQFFKAYAKEGTTVIVDGDYNLEKATIDGIASATTEVLNANFGLKYMKTTKAYSKVSDIVTNKVEWLKNTKLVSSASTLISKLKLKILDTKIINKAPSVDEYGFDNEATTNHISAMENVKTAVNIGKEKFGEKIVKDIYKNISKDILNDAVSSVAS